jgi:hypothetical protein
MPPMLAQVCVLVRAARAAGAATMPTPDHPTPSEVSARWADLTGCSCAPRTNKQIRKQYNKKRLKKSCCQITPLANMSFSGTRYFRRIREINMGTIGGCPAREPLGSWSRLSHRGRGIGDESKSNQTGQHT